MRERLLDEALKEMREALEQSQLDVETFHRRKETTLEEVEEPLPHGSPPVTHIYPLEPPAQGQVWLKLVTGTAAVGLAFLLSIGSHEKGTKIHPPAAPPPVDVTKKPKGGPSAPAVEDTAPFDDTAPEQDKEPSTAVPDQSLLVTAIMDGRAKIRVHGNEIFKTEVRDALTKISSVPEGLHLLEELENNPPGGKIFVKYGSEPTARACAETSTLPCSEGDVVVEVRDLSDHRINASLHFVLAHELDHARRFITGSDVSHQRPTKEGFPNREEELAVDFENVIRRALGSSEREAYYRYRNVSTQVVRGGSHH